MKKKSKYGMPPPTSRKEFEHNVNLVLEQVLQASDEDNLEFIRNSMAFTIPHLERLKYLPNRRINLNTVNEMLRNQANTTHWMSFMSKPEIDIKEE